MTDTRSIDILMITYRRPHYTRLALDRLLATCDESMRVWLWHNGDHAETLELVKSYESHPRVHRFHHCPENLRLREPTNWLFRESTGAFVTKVDDDCLMPFGWADTLRAAMDEEPRFGMLGCWRFQEEDFDAEHTRRNLQNIHQDKALAESQRPLVAPTGPNPNGIYTHDEDKITLAYWGLMEGMREKGWQIDRAKLVDPAHAVRIIPSPARKAQPDGWVYPAMARIAAGGATAPAVRDLKFVDIDSINPTRPKDYGKSEPVVPRDAKSNATLEWEAAALARVDKAPSFVQPMIMKNAEAAARANGSNFVTVKLLDELQAKQRK